ncbi:lens induction in camera-type eye [Branchiostoma belcheri]|nr:lens induction in camera-type eye [Branchiostoma belcheri]
MDYYSKFFEFAKLNKTRATDVILKMKLFATHGIPVKGDEAALGREMGKQLVENNIRVSHLVHDGDGHIFKGMSEVMEEETDEPTKSLSDTIHLSRGIARAVTKATWSAHMWPGKTRAERTQVKNRFGDDLKLRLEEEHR